MLTYPKDRKNTGHFARFAKALFKSNAVAIVGPDAVLLLLFVAAKEDELHYSEAPRFWRRQILDAIGKASPKAILEPRRIAEEKGLLHYEKGDRVTEPEYWTLVPSWLEPFMGSVSRSKTERQNGLMFQNGTRNGTRNGTLPNTRIPNKILKPRKRG